MYSKGRDVPQDDGEAVKWFRRAAAQGLADGCPGEVNEARSFPYGWAHVSDSRIRVTGRVG